ncbi:hypothetical protein IFM89_001424 [Coptis chinensis]|uniref:Uncharacterized protein n=1 Tax=Coptis chinensis TaxID=261450 RepID=A0A835H0K3_9MAGN|nr:hypothetical protein IFM89_001424 [Coptis chinensis]
MITTPVEIFYFAFCLFTIFRTFIDYFFLYQFFDLIGR